MRGRKPKPTVLKRLHHSDQPINEHEPVPEGDLSVESDSAPAHLTAEQRAAWNYAVANSPPGMLKAIDASILEVWAVAYCYYRRAVAAQELLDSAEGATALLVTTPNGHQQQSPYIPIINRQAEILSKAAEKLGFSPTARPRIGLTLGGGELNGSTHAPATGEESIDDYLARTPRSKAVH